MVYSLCRPLFSLFALTGPVCAHQTAAAAPTKERGVIANFRKSGWYAEQIRETQDPAGVRIACLAPPARSFDPRGPTRLLFYATPNGSGVEQTLGGEMNGFLHAMTVGTPEEGKWGVLGGPCAYRRWLQPAPGLQAAGRKRPPGRAVPTRPPAAPGGAAFLEQIAGLSPARREEAVLREIVGGNLPGYLRRFKPVRLVGTDRNGMAHTLLLEVSPDYLCVGSDADFARMPMTPKTAQRIADRFGWLLPTRKMVDAIYRQAELRLEPLPLTEDRESVSTFALHNRLIEGQRAGRPLGLLTAGMKKDLVMSNLIPQRPGHVAIYGWHRLDGTPIQPLYAGHIDSYVDYSHGARMVRQRIELDGKPASARDILRDPVLATLLSDEGPIDPPAYPLD